MKKQLFSMVAGFVSLAIGIAAVIWYTASPRAEGRVVITPVESTPNCKESRSFPGRSLALAELKKFKGGFFPANSFNDGWENSDRGMNVWYGKFLRAMDEQSLLKSQDENVEVYRFLWLRTFHHPVMLRLVRDGYSFNLTSVELNGAGGYDPGTRWRTAKLRIEQEEWCEFMLLLEKASFWSMETYRRDDLGTDGSQWVLEGVRHGRYHIVDRWMPREGDYREACLFLLKLSGRDLKTLGNDLY